MKRQVKVLCLAAAIAAGGWFSASAENGFVEEPDRFDGSAAVFTFSEYDQYVIYSRVGYVTDIVLRQGEEVSQIAAGNTLQWMVDKDTVAGRSHIYLKPLADSTTNVIINTNLRSYRLIVATSDEYLYFAVRWDYPREEEYERYNAMAERTAAVKENIQKDTHRRSRWFFICGL